jgi:uncharacterized MAPEG superfamily protein
MTIPQWCLFIAVLLPPMLAIVGGTLRKRQFGHIDNKNPRQQQAKMSGAGARAMSAQQNAWEALAMFTPAVLVAHLNGAVAGQAALAAMIFVVARMLHPIFYLANIDALRSLSWAVGFACCIWLFVLAM